LRKILWRWIVPIVFSLIILTQNISALFPMAEVAEAATDYTPPACIGHLLEYEEELYITWENWGWTNKKVADILRKVSVVEVRAEDFTVRENVTVTMHLAPDLDYAGVHVHYLDWHWERIGGGYASDLGDTIVSSAYTDYIVNKTNGKILRMAHMRLDNLDKIINHVELLWAYYDSVSAKWAVITTHEWNYDILEFRDMSGLSWGYSVKPHMNKEEIFDGPYFNKWAVVDEEVTFRFADVELNCMELQNLGECSSMLCDRHTGIKLEQVWLIPDRWSILCTSPDRTASYSLGECEWNTDATFTIYAKQKLVYTNFKLVGVPVCINSSYTDVSSSIDGVISAGEWNDANFYYISYDENVCHFYVKNNESNLLIALDAKFDSTFTNTTIEYDLVIIGLDIGCELDKSNDVELYFNLSSAEPGNPVDINALIIGWLDTALQDIKPVVGLGSASNSSGNMQYELNIFLNHINLQINHGDTVGLAVGIYDGYHSGTSADFNVLYPPKAKTKWQSFLLSGYDPDSFSELVTWAGLGLSSNTPPKVDLESPTVGVRVKNPYGTSLTATVGLEVSSKDYKMSIDHGPITLDGGEAQDVSITIPGTFDDGTILTLKFIVTPTQTGYRQTTCVDSTIASSDTTLSDGVVYLALIDSLKDPTYKLPKKDSILDEYGTATINFDELMITLMLMKLDIKHDEKGNPIISTYPVNIEFGGDFDSNADVEKTLQSISGHVSLGTQVIDAATFIVKKGKMDNSVAGVGDVAAAYDLATKVSTGYEPQTTYEKVDYALSAGELLATAGLAIGCPLAALIPFDGPFGEMAICPAAIAALAKVKLAHGFVNIGKATLDYATQQDQGEAPPDWQILAYDTQYIRTYDVRPVHKRPGTQVYVWRSVQSGKYDVTTHMILTRMAEEQTEAKEKKSSSESSLAGAGDTEATGFTWPVVVPYTTNTTKTCEFNSGLLIYLDEDEGTASIEMVYDAGSAEFVEENVIQIRNVDTKHMRIEQIETEDSTVVTMSESSAQSNLELHVYVGDMHIGVGSDGQMETEVPGSWYSGDVIDGTETIILPNTYTQFRAVIETTTNGSNASTIETYNLRVSSLSEGHKTFGFSCNETVNTGETKEMTIDTTVSDIEVVDVEVEPTQPIVGEPVMLKALIFNSLNELKENVPVEFYVRNIQVGSTQYISIPPRSYMYTSTSWMPAYEDDYFITAQVGPIADGNHTTLHRKTITSLKVIPEFPLLIVLPLFIIATLLAVIFSKKRRIKF